MNTDGAPKTQPTAIVIDQLALLRLGVESVLSSLDFRVVGSSARADDGIRRLRNSAAEIVIVGNAPDLKHQNALKVMKSLQHSPKVIFLLDKADSKEVARLISVGADGLLLRNVTRSDLTDAIKGVERGERVVAPGLAAGTIGRVGPTESETRAGLSPRELDVLAELADGATYDEIAKSLVVTKATVKTHLIHIYDKLEVKNRNEAVARAIALGMLG